ncbi:WAT1-related protein At5g64700 isoform X2 [Arachis ipaensis]|uniref:WAT1-related protein At5g64700 isoform X2 n=1 Tax=Arachis ipaensis TaxID=130454 RepID=UPI000A2B8F5F|nr:WAT1-related protein At5g64700 isoform X2 [Arachis ipaensis]
MGEVKPYLAVVLMQFIYSVMTLLTKAVFNQGMNSSVFIFYRQMLGTVILVPLAFIFERKSAVPLSFMTFLKIFMFSFIGMEKVNIKTESGIAKIASVLLCIGGVVILALYKGPHLVSGHHHTQHLSSRGQKWILGSLLFFLAVITWSFWLVIQAQFLKSYPSKLYFTSLQCMSSAIQSFLVAIAFERDFQQWKLGWDMRLLAVVYTGILVNGVVYYLQAWVIEKRGPVFSIIWNPLSFIMSTTGSILLLGEPLCLGSVVGGIMLVLSLYSVLWAKSKEGVSHQKSLPVKAPKECGDTKITEASDAQPHPQQQI